MSYQSRKKLILSILERDQEASIETLARAAGTSGVTLRRDLTVMAGEGLLVRTHGGAMKLDADETRKHFVSKIDQHAEAKLQIAERASQEIKDGDTIFMDCGSTVFALCPFLRSRKIKVITNSLPVANSLSGTSVSINLVGGELDQDRQAVHGFVALEHISRYQADKAFIGVDALDEHALYAHSDREASITMAYASQARKVYLLCDSSKFGQRAYLEFADMQLLDVIITDHRHKLLDQLGKKVQVNVAGES